MENKMLQRQIAYKVQAGDILSGKANFEGERLTSLECAGKNVLRINIMGNVVDKYSNAEKRFASLTVDDGSGQVRIKGFSDQFDLLNTPEIGATVNIIGMIKYYNNEIYIMPEVIRKTDPRWLNIRRLELGSEGGMPNSAANSTSTSLAPPAQPQTLAPQNYKVEERFSSEPAKITTEKIEKVENVNFEIDSPKLKALALIKKEGEINIDKLAALMDKTKDDINPVINDLLSEGEIYELRPGYLCSVN